MKIETISKDEARQFLVNYHNLNNSCRNMVKGAVALSISAQLLFTVKK